MKKFLDSESLWARSQGVLDASGMVVRMMFDTVRALNARPWWRGSTRLQSRLDTLYEVHDRLHQMHDLLQQEGDTSGNAEHLPGDPRVR